MLITDPASPDFNSYASAADLQAFAAARGYAIPDDAAERENLLVQAMDYLAGINWRGCRTNSSQPQAWPRSGVKADGVELPDSAIPRQLVQAQCRLAIEAQEIELMPSFDAGGEVVQESVSGAVSVSYAPGTSRSAASFPWLSNMLRGLAVSSGQVRLVRG
ncbi:DnaT-like ssDNA-binding protein [Franconibacter pulveris 601]|uniref:DnaT-like ssDNA-binding protein n=1 Tax=Franconibacter pulveris TaxID=435910 RepID=UPI000462FBE9|nr:DnaT-like ssDNA-binding protein [Franconibacter pulveris]